MIKRQLAAQMGNMTPEEPAQMQELMGSFGLSSMIEPVAPATPALQHSSTPANRKCRIWWRRCNINNVIQDGQVIANVCFSQSNNIGISDEDFQTLIGM